MSSSDDEMEPLYEVEKILNKRFNPKGRPEYFIKWKGYAQKTWEPIEHLSNIPDMIFDFQQKEKEERKKKKEVPRAAKSVCKSQLNSDPGKVQNRLDKNNQKKNKIQYKKKSKLSLEWSSSSGEQNPKNINENQQPNIVQSSSEDDVPIIKNYTEVSDDEPGYPAPEDPNRQGNICHDIVKKVHQIQRINGKWMVEVQFQSQRFEKSWHQRDIIRLLYPYQLLVFYEKLAKQRKYQLY